MCEYFIRLLLTHFTLSLQNILCNMLEAVRSGNRNGTHDISYRQWVGDGDRDREIAREMLQHSSPTYPSVHADLKYSPPFYGEHLIKDR